MPDITLITPVFDSESKKIIFFTASRGHHADVGGILPGSMPPTSVNIFEEGAEIVKGTPLVVVEAMKMENELVAERDGVIKKIYVTAGQTVEGGAKLVEIE